MTKVTITVTGSNLAEIEEAFAEARMHLEAGAKGGSSPPSAEGGRFALNVEEVADDE